MSPQNLCFAVQLTVVGEADPQLPARVLALLTHRNLLPRSFNCERDGDDALRIDLVTETDAELDHRQLAAQARRIPTVIQAHGSRIGRPRAVAPAPSLEARLRAEGFEVGRRPGPIGTTEHFLSFAQRRARSMPAASAKTRRNQAAGLPPRTAAASPVDG